jgi:hypothetical protein
VRGNVGHDDGAPFAKGCHQHFGSSAEPGAARVRDIGRPGAPRRAGEQPEIVWIALQVGRRKAEVQPVAGLQRIQARLQALRAAELALLERVNHGPVRADTAVDLDHGERFPLSGAKALAQLCVAGLVERGHVWHTAPIEGTLDQPVKVCGHDRLDRPRRCQSRDAVVAGIDDVDVERL